VTTALLKTRGASACRCTWRIAMLPLCLDALAFAAGANTPISGIRQQCRTGNSLPKLDALAAAVAAQPKDAELLACLGDVNTRLGRQSAAMDGYAKSVAINPRNTGVWRRLGKLQSRALETDPGNHGLRLALIETIVHTGPDADLEKEINAFVKLSSTEERLELTRILISFGKLDDAQPILIELTNLDPVPVEAWAQLGLILMEKEDFENAVMELGQAAQADPKSSRYCLALSEALLRWHHYSTALEYLQAVKASFGDLPQFQYNLAYSYYGVRELDVAISILNALLKQQPGYAPARFLLGNCYVAKGDLARGEQMLRSAVDADKTKAAYYSSLAQVKRYQGEIAEALLVIHKGLSLDPQNTELIFESALCHESKGDLAIAQDQLEKLVAKQPGLTKAHRALVRVYGRMGNDAAAAVERQKLAQLESQERTPEHNSEDNR